VKLRVDDTVTGNGDGVVQAGEQFKLFYKAKNFGTGTYPGGTLTAFDLDGAFTIGGGGTSAYPAINSLASQENTTGITLTESSVAVEHRLRLRIVDTYGRAYEDTVELRTPLPPTGVEIDPGQGPDRLNITWARSASSDVAAYNVYRASGGAGPFNLVNIDPVPHALFLNTGLNSTATYFYKISALDASGNESALSAAYSGSTNPAQLTGWPLDMQSETTSSPAVGDIDGDGTFAVGKDIQPGTYSSAGPVGDGACYWKRVNGSDIVDNALSKKAQIVQIEPTDTSFTTNECQAWQLTDQPVPQSGPGDLMGALGQLGQIIARNPGSAPPPPANPGG